jgi:AcrR family transcriptional regulator
VPSRFGASRSGVRCPRRSYCGWNDRRVASSAASAAVRACFTRASSRVVARLTSTSRQAARAAAAASGAAPAARAPGRPRSAGVDEAILAAALAELGERGYARMSVDAVAARAGVSKPTVYLRHPTKADLATAAIASMRIRPRPAPTDDVRADLVAHLRLLRAGLERPNGMTMLGTVLAEERETPELLALFRERLVAPRRRELRAVLEAARARGELRADANLEVAVTALVGAFFARYLAGDALGGRFITTLVDTILDGLRAG